MRDRLHSELHRQLQREVYWTKLSESIEEATERHLAVSTERRRLFISREGFIGLAPVEAEQGDVIFAIKGCRTPHVLRLTFPASPDLDTDSDNSAPAAAQFRLVGDCYLDGFMDVELDDMFRDHPEVWDGDGWQGIDIV